LKISEKSEIFSKKSCNNFSRRGRPERHRLTPLNTHTGYNKTQAGKRLKNCCLNPVDIFYLRNFCAFKLDFSSKETSCDGVVNLLGLNTREAPFVLSSYFSIELNLIQELYFSITSKSILKTRQSLV